MRFKSAIKPAAHKSDESRDYVPRLTSISFLNFKAFGEWQTLPIKPLNLIFGRNSSGKSSIFHALLWIRHLLLNENLNVYKPTLSGDFVDLGGLRRYVHFSKKNKHASRKYGFRFEVEIPKEKFLDAIMSGSPLRRGMRSRFLDRMGKSAAQEIKEAWSEFLELFGPIAGKINLQLEVVFENFRIPQPERFRFFKCLPEVSLILGGEKILLFSPKQKAMSIEKSHFEENYSTYYSVTCDSKKLYVKGIPILANLIQSIVSQRLKLHGQKKPKWVPSKQQVNSIFQDIDLSLGGRGFRTRISGLRFIPKGRYTLGREDTYNKDARDLTRNVLNKLMLSNLKGTFHDFVNECGASLYMPVIALFRSLNYLAAYRNYPEREISEASMVNVRPGPYGEESFQDILKDPKMISAINRACKKLGADFKFGTYLSQHAGRHVTIQHEDGYPLSFRDIGFGWSQVIPVIVELVQSSSTLTTLLVEQPELHLHPSNQSELMDVVLDHVTQNAESTVFLEVHSEQMILRLLKRIKEKRKGSAAGSVRPNQCSILHVFKGKEGSVIRPYRVSDSGTMIDPWPGGFFESALKDL